MLSSASLGEHSAMLGGHCLDWRENVISDTSGVIGEGGTYTAKFI